MEAGRTERHSPVIQEVILEDLQEGLTEAPQGLRILLNPLHVLQEALRGVPDLRGRQAVARHGQVHPPPRLAAQR